MLHLSSPQQLHTHTPLDDLDPLAAEVEPLLGPDPHDNHGEEDGRDREGDVEPQHRARLEPDQQHARQGAREDSLRFVGRSIGWLVALLVGCFRWLFWLAGWLIACLVSWFIGWLDDSLVV